MKLTEEQLRSPLWQELRKEYERKLASMRKLNDNTTGEIETAKLRGEIKVVKGLLKLDPEWSH